MLEKKIYSMLSTFVQSFIIVRAILLPALSDEFLTWSILCRQMVGHRFENYTNRAGIISLSVTLGVWGDLWIWQIKFPSQLPMPIFLHSTFQVQNKLQAVAYAKANADAYYAASGTYPYILVTS